MHTAGNGSIIHGIELSLVSAVLVFPWRAVNGVSLSHTVALRGRRRGTDFQRDHFWRLSCRTVSTATCSCLALGLPSPPAPTESQLEAGRKLTANHEAVIGDIMKNAGLMDTDSEFVQRAVDITVFNLASSLQGKDSVIRMEGRLGGEGGCQAGVSRLRRHLGVPSQQSQLPAGYVCKRL